ncbi:MAG: sugar ABC transporter substrate-binding protein [Pseudonocardia sp.]
MALAALGASACGSSASEPSDGPRLAFLGLAAANTYTTAAFEAAKQEAEARGASITFYDGAFKADTQYNQIQDAATSKNVDGLLIMPNDGAAVAPAVERAIAAGVKVVALEFPIGPEATTLEPQVPGITSTVGYNVVTEAQQLADQIATACQGLDPCEVALLMGDRTTRFDKIRYDTIIDGLAAHPNVDVVATADAHYLRTEGISAMRTILQAHGDDLDVVATGSNDAMLLGAEDAINTAGREGQYKLLGWGGTVDGLAKVRSGDWVCTAAVHIPATEAKIGTGYLVDAIAGKEVPSSVVMNDLSPVGPVATKESLAEAPDFTGEWN